MQGTFVIKARSAKLTHDTELMGKMDPYVVIKIGATTQKTKVHEDGGKTPKWEETFKFPATIGDIVNFEIWDKEKIKSDDFVGGGSFSISQLHVSSKNEFDHEIFYEKKKAGEVLFEIEFIPEAKKEVEQQVIEEKKETDQDVIVKLQAELDKLWEAIEEEREKGKPVDQKKKKDFSALHNAIGQTKNEITKTKAEVAKFDQELQGVIEKFKGFLDDQKAAKRYLEGEHSILGTLRTTVIPGIVAVSVIDGEVNNKSDKEETGIAVICGDQVKEIRSKGEAGKNPEWKETVEFKVSVESTVGIVVYSKDQKGGKTLGAGGVSLYHVSHDNAAEKGKIKLWNKDIEIGYVNYELIFKGL